MAPTALRKQVHRDRFGQVFSTLRTQTYYDPASRGPGSHTIRSISWNPTGHLIATCSADKTLRIWNPDKPQVKNSTELKGHTASIERVAWNPTKEAELASVSLDGTVRFWDVRRKECISTVQLGARGLSLAWADDGMLVMVGAGDRADDEALVPISVPSFTAHPSLPQGGQVNEVIVSPTRADLDVYYILITCGNGQVKIGTYPKGQSPGSEPGLSSTQGTPALQILHTFQGHTSAAQCLALSPNGRWLATGGSDAMTMLWDTKDWVCAHPLSGAAGTVRSVSFSFDGTYLTSASEEGEEMEIIHVESGDVIATVPLQGNQAGVPRAKSSSGKAELVVEEGVGAKGIGKGLVKVSNVGSVTGLNCVAWHPHRYWIAYSGEPGGLRVIGAASGQL